MRKTIIIVGMHRSGTSLTASLLKKSGLDIGKELLGPEKSNTSGHFENTDFFFFHVNTLRKLNYHANGWDTIEIEEMNAQMTTQAKEIINKNQSEVWGWKDPRTTLFLNFWAKLLPNACFLFVYRSPAEVVDSLYRRGDSIIVENPELAIDSWLHYNNLILKYYNQHKNNSLLVNIKTLINNYPFFIETLNHKFDVNLNPNIETLFNYKLFKEFSGKSELADNLYKIKPEAKLLYQLLVNNSWTPENTKPLTANNLIINNFEDSSAEDFFSEWLRLYVKPEPVRVAKPRVGKLSKIKAFFFY